MIQGSDDEVRQIIADIYNVPLEEVLPEKPFTDFPGTWVEATDLVIKVEDTFGISMSDAVKIRTVQDFMDYLHERAGK